MGLGGVFRRDEDALTLWDVAGNKLLTTEVVRFRTTFIIWLIADEDAVFDVAVSSDVVVLENASADAAEDSINGESNNPAPPTFRMPKSNSVLYRSHCIHGPFVARVEMRNPNIRGTYKS